MDTYLFIDGENFLHKVEDALKESGTSRYKIDTNRLDFSSLIAEVLTGYNIVKKTFYVAKLRMFEETREKSRILIHKQRVLKQTLEKQGFEVLIAGNVRPQAITQDGKSTYVFKEKGVDVKIAVDLVSLCCDKKMDTAILCSSDSDLQPAITEIKRRGVQVVYLGFEISPNKGLTFTCNKTILFRNSEIVKHCPPRR
ncbi:MAG: NYN domain-containing protein [Patescibacteria group bacterium]